MKKIIQKIWNRLRRRRILPKPNIVVRMDDIPDNFDANTFYLIGNEGNEWCLAFQCPCDCKEAIQLNLSKDSRPSWGVTIHKDQTISAMPSVWRTVGCRSHFFVIHSRIEWAGKATN